MTGIFIRRGKEIQRERDTGRTPHDNAGRECRAGSTSQRLPAIPEAESKAKNRFSPGAFRKSMGLLIP